MRFCCFLDVKFGEGKKFFVIGVIVGIVVVFVVFLLVIFVFWCYKFLVFRDFFKKKDIDCKFWNLIVVYVFIGYCEYILV